MRSSGQRIETTEFHFKPLVVGKRRKMSRIQVAVFMNVVV